MTNQAISAILDDLCNKARDVAHSTQGLLGLLRETRDLDGETCAGFATGNVDRMLQLIDDTRELLSTGRREPSDMRRFDFAAGVRQIAEALNLASPGGEERIEVCTPQGALVVVQDQAAIEQVLTRLLDAIFRLPASGELRVTARADADAVFLAISASTPDACARLAGWLCATPDSATLGDPLDIPIGVAVMAAAKRIRGLDAQIVIDGGEIIVRVPSKDSAHPVADSPDQIDRLNVLVAEDCDESYALATLLLRGEAVRRANDGIEAVELVKRQRFDVVFMDVHMDGMDGYSAIRAIRNWETETGNARTPIVILSSDDLQTQKRQAAQAGCAGYLRKPLRPSDLTDVLERLKNLRALTRPMV